MINCKGKNQGVAKSQGWLRIPEIKEIIINLYLAFNLINHFIP